VSLDWSELLDPAPAVPLELEGEELEDAPPLAGLFVVSLELELELDGDELLGEVVEPDEDAEPDGEVLGEVVEPEGTCCDRSSGCSPSPPPYRARE